MTVADWRKFFSEEHFADETAEVEFHSDCCGCSLTKVVSTDLYVEGPVITLG